MPASPSKCPMKPPKPLTYCQQCFFNDEKKGCRHGAVQGGLANYAARIDTANMTNSIDKLVE